MSKLLGLVAVFSFLFSLPAEANCIKGNCFNGYGTFVFNNGDRYVGDFVGGKPEGKGILYLANGNKYIGHWAASFREGEGRYVFAEGHEYRGQFSRNQFSGQGVMNYANGDRYDGLWKNDRPNGQGIYYFSGGRRFEGEFVDGRFHGYGVMYYADGRRYAGHWHNSKQHGPGTLYLPDGGVSSGQWVDGELLDDSQAIEARIPSAPVEEPSGEFDRNCNLQFCQSGKGNYTYGDGSKYYGEFIEGLPEGEGTIYYANGDKYSGGWKDHAPHGQGVMYYRNGRVLGAMWEYGHPVRQIDTPTGDPILTEEVNVDVDQSVKIWAVVIGVGLYQHMPTLRYTDDDAYQIYAFLKSPEGGALPDEQIRLLIDEVATRQNILQTMREVFLQADANDVVLFYFSGHGLEGSFLPFDYDGFYNRLEHQEIKDLLEESQAKHKLVVADACHSGSILAVRKPLDAALAKYYEAFENTRGGLALLMSSKGEEFSLEDGGLRSGVFSHFLILGLRGQADADHDKIITVGELYNFVYQKVRTYTASAQSPTLTGNYDRNMPVGLVR